MQQTELVRWPWLVVAAAMLPLIVGIIVVFAPVALPLLYMQRHQHWWPRFALRPDRGKAPAASEVSEAGRHAAASESQPLSRGPPAGGRGASEYSAETFTDSCIVVRVRGLRWETSRTDAWTALLPLLPLELELVDLFLPLDAKARPSGVAFLTLRSATTGVSSSAGRAATPAKEAAALLDGTRLGDDRYLRAFASTRKELRVSRERSCAADERGASLAPQAFNRAPTSNTSAPGSGSAREAGPCASAASAGIYRHIAIVRPMFYISLSPPLLFVCRPWRDWIDTYSPSYVLYLTAAPLTICLRLCSPCLRVGAAVPAAVCRWGLCPCCPGVGRCLSGVYNHHHMHIYIVDIMCICVCGG